MKFAFFLVSLVCALTLSFLAFIMATGRIPFRVPDEPAVKISETKIDRGVSTNVAAVKNLVESLELEREKLKKKEAALDARQEQDEMQLKVARMEDLKQQIENGIAELRNEMTVIEASERKNLQSIGDVYSKMEPENAADILQKMEPQRAAMILYLMTERNAAGILDAVVGKGEEAQEMAKSWADIIRKLKHETNGTGL